MNAKIGAKYEIGLKRTFNNDCIKCTSLGFNLFASQQVFWVVKADFKSVTGRNNMNTWIKCALIRAIKTVAQTAVATIGTSAVISDVDWKIVASASILAGVLSLLTSVAGLPEGDSEKEELPFNYWEEGEDDADSE